MSLILDGSSGVTFPNSTVQASAGVVLQVVQGTTSTPVSNSTQSAIDTGLSATITPKFNTSKILILISHPETYKTPGNASNDIGMYLVKNSSSLIQFNYNLGYTNSATPLVMSVSYTYLDSPATTSATTYKTQFTNADIAAAYVQVQTNSRLSTITLLEIAG